MKLTLPLLTIFLAFSWYVVPAPNAPQEPMPVFTEAVKRPAKLFYDRIGPEEQPVRMARCKTPGTIYYVDGKCYRPERIPGVKS